MSRNTWAIRRIALGVALVAACLVLGLADTVALSRRGHEEAVQSYLRAALSGSTGFALEDIDALAGAPEDAGLPALERIRRQAVLLRRANPDCHFVRIMAVRAGKVVQLADSEPPGSPKASAAGDASEEASPALRDAFVTGIAFAEGPLKGRWGERITAFAPIRQDQTGVVVAVLGMDWDVQQWRRQIGVYRWFGLTLTILPVLLLTAIFAGYIRVEHVNHMLTDEMTERRRIQRELECLAKQDPLTGLANRRTLDTVLDNEWRRALRAQLPLSLIMLDIDGFKAYNDHYGHTSGDGALRQVAEVIREAAKRPGDQTCRYGGEEFVVILPGADLEGARHVAESIRASVEAAAIAHERSVTGRLLTVSVGITSTIPTVEDTPSVFITRSDEALYRAKAAGRNRVE